MLTFNNDLHSRALLSIFDGGYVSVCASVCVLYECNVYACCMTKRWNFHNSSFFLHRLSFFPVLDKIQSLKASDIIQCSFFSIILEKKFSF